MTAPYRYFNVGCDLETAKVFRTKTRRVLRSVVFTEMRRVPGLRPAMDDWRGFLSHVVAVVWAGVDGISLPMSIPFKPHIGDPRFRVAVMVKEVDKQDFKKRGSSR